MSGAKKGVAKKISDIENRAIYTHCYGHTLNLACSDAVKGCKILRDTLDTTREITKLIKFHRKEKQYSRKSKKDIYIDLETPGISLLCPTRWTVHGDSLCSVCNNYSFLIDTFERSREVQPTLRQKVD